MSKTISTLIIKKLLGKITPQEQMEIDNYAAQSDANRRMVEHYTKKKHVLEEVKLREQPSHESDWKKIEKGLPGKVVRFNRNWVIAAAAAVVLLILGLRWYYNKDSDKKISYAQVKYEASSYHQAILTKYNGQVLHLHELKNGSLAEGQNIIKNDSQLIYPLGYHSNQSGMNILKTPKGNYYSIRLSDGSTAWLNTASSIIYPTSFTGEQRKVEVEGEVYFDVVKDASRPFIVKVHGVEIEVKGTKFTVNSYKESGTMTTTLLEGSVKIKGKGYVDSLQAGEQAILTEGRKFQKVKVDKPEERVQGWQENKFAWSKADLKTILDDLSHWYEYSLDYETEVPSRLYNFTLDRSEKLENIFDVLQTATALKFRLENKTIIIYR